MTILNLTKDVKGFNTYGRQPADYKIFAKITQAGGEQTATVPNFATKYLVIFSYEPGSTVWISVNSTATIPSLVTFSATDSELNPVAYELESGDVIHCFTSDVTAQIGMSFYVLQ